MEEALRRVLPARPRWSWPTGRRPCCSPTGWRCWPTAGSPPSARTASCSRPSRPTATLLAQSSELEGVRMTDESTARPSRLAGHGSPRTRPTRTRRTTSRPAACSCAPGRTLLGELVRPYRRRDRRGAAHRAGPGGGDDGRARGCRRRDRQRAARRAATATTRRSSSVGGGCWSRRCCPAGCARCSCCAAARSARTILFDLRRRGVRPHAGAVGRRSTSGSPPAG